MCVVLVFAAGVVGFIRGCLVVSCLLCVGVQVVPLPRCVHVVPAANIVSLVLIARVVRVVCVLRIPHVIRVIVVMVVFPCASLLLILILCYSDCRVVARFVCIALPVLLVSVLCLACSYLYLSFCLVFLLLFVCLRALLLYLYCSYCRLVYVVPNVLALFVLRLSCS